MADSTIKIFKPVNGKLRSFRIKVDFNADIIFKIIDKSIN